MRSSTRAVLTRRAQSSQPWAVEGRPGPDQSSTTARARPVATARARSAADAASNSTYVTMRHVETAAMVGLISVRMPSHIVFGKVIAVVPVMKIAMTTSSKARIIASSAPATMPGRTMGSVTCQSARQRVAPSDIAACSSEGSSERSEKLRGGNSRKLEPLNEIGTTTNSGKIKKMPTSTLIAVSATRRAEGRRRRGSRLTAGSEDAVESHHAVGDEEHAQRDEEQDEGERRAHTPVEELRNLLVDEQGDHDVGPAAEQCRRDVVAERGDEDDEPAAHHPG